METSTNLKLSIICWFLLLNLLWAMLPMSVHGADAPAALNARESGVALYSRQDSESDRIATLEKDETLFPIAESVGSQVWYMVRTKQGLVGWVRAADIVVSSQAKESFTETDSSSSSWSARSSDGRTFNGTWSVAPSSTEKSASGGWTLSNASGTTVMRGTWTADKHSTGWNGVWRASVEGREKEFSGSWSAEFPYVHNAPFKALFAAAAKEAIRGLWTGGSESGSWSIRAAK
ncbi:MAG TPA: SH3 domain-containing protein [Candidatus Binatia bacterium]|jgi:hypothetical protein